MLLDDTVLKVAFFTALLNTYLFAIAFVCEEKM